MARYGDLVARELQKSETTTLAVKELPIVAFAEADGTALAQYSAGGATPGFSLQNSEAMGITWDGNGNPDPVGCTVLLPFDLDLTQDVDVVSIWSKNGATAGDTLTPTHQVFFHPVGALHDADADAGGDGSAIDGDATAKTVASSTLTIDSADLPAAVPCYMTLTIQPKDGKLGTDEATMHGIYLLYTKKLVAIA